MGKLWKDELGFVVSSELALVSSILVLGLMVGLASVRDQVVQELADVGAGIAVMQQGYDWNQITAHSSSTAGSQFLDTTDWCDDDPFGLGTGPDPVDYPALWVDVDTLNAASYEYP